MVEHMKQKMFKTLEQQIEILREKGLVINDVENAKKILFKENYFFITGYRHLFMTEKISHYFRNDVGLDVGSYRLYLIFEDGAFGRHSR